MKDGKCIKCGAETVHTMENGVGGLYGLDVFDGRSSEKAKVVTFACVTCGYFENYIIDPKKIQMITEKWKKV